ncbi:CD2 antigen cytoplasmic tail-binding protein 2 [Nymphon striatum]|nr:CD2 antigen cytoplasmic tail-binding protein 2 [Nymphon striatum]
MSKRKLKERFMDDGRDEFDMEDPEPSSVFESKHSLDSDEEDENIKKKYDVLGEEDVDGQEDSTIDYDGDIKITPFNMKEEMEEGHFDVEGNYYVDNASDVKDHWIDNIDWVKVKTVDKTEVNQETSNSSKDIDYSNMKEEDKIPVYLQMLDLMKPGEDSLKSIKRLGGSGNQGSASSRWLKKKKKISDKKDGGSSSNTENLENLTSLADRLLQAGEYEIYQYTFEKISFIVKCFNEKIEASKTHIPEGTIDDDALDIFADNLDSNKSKPTKDTSTKDATDNTQEVSEISDEVMWEFKWEDKEDEDIHGPHSSTEMQCWVEEEYFPNGVYANVGEYAHLVNALAPYIDTKEVQLTKKQLSIELSSLALKKNGYYLTAGQLALHIEALVAIRANPRSFMDKDLLCELEDTKITSNYEFAIVQAAKCHAGEFISKNDARQLLKNIIYAGHYISLDEISASIYAAHCIINRYKYNFLRVPVMKMCRKLKMKLNFLEAFGGIYLILDILKALRSHPKCLSNRNYDKAVMDIASKQMVDGSFDSNVIVTTSFFKVLENRLLEYDIHNIYNSHYSESNKNYHLSTTSPKFDFLKKGDHQDISNGKNEIYFDNADSRDTLIIDYIIWIGKNVSSSLSLTLPVKNNVAFYKIMQVASIYDERYNFQSSLWSHGHYITEISGYTENKTTNEYWLLYKMDLKTNKPVIFGTGAADRVKSGIEWLLSRRLPNKAWDYMNTGRAILALQLSHTPSGRWSDYGGVEAKMSIKQMENEILAELARDKLMSQYDDATFISYLGALVATCHDLRNFYGHNLLRILETRMDKFTNLLQYSMGVLTLCSASERVKDSHIGTMLNRARNINGPNCLFCTEITSGLVLALSCAREQTNQRNKIIDQAIQSNVKRLQQAQQEDGGFGTTFATSLAIQALHAAQAVTPEITSGAYNFLQREQKQTGSFVNVFIATVVLPAISGNTFLNMKRANCPPKGVLVPDVGPNMVFVKYRVEDAIRNAFNISGSVAVPEGTTAHQIMNSLATESPGSFQYVVEEIPGPFRQIVVVELNGLRGNQQRRLLWNVYRKKVDGQPIRSNTGVAMIPHHNELIIFRFERA